ncbi:ATP-binding protein [Hellea balneolensis]|uniref:ATP-binding protein n=1 Tax=Hellea balneolensis TaxID=287478 RepID=UPI00054CFFFD|nr:ATP-binding protein [Hellea balneolensis]
MPLKKYLPKSLFGRALLIIMLPIAIMQMAVAYFFFNAHWNQVTGNLSDSVAADISVAVQLYKQSPSSDRAERLDDMLRPQMELSVALEEGDKLPLTTRDAFFSNLDKTLRRSLGNSLIDEFWFDTTRYPNHIDIRVAVDEGVLRFIAARERVFAPTGFVFIFWLITATVLLSLVSIVFIRNQAKPITELAAAADAFGKGQDISNFKPSGASEVRLAGQSFLKMRGRIRRHIEQRTTMLAGVSHDLRTPLTRLKLHLAMQDKTDENDEARQDIKDMEAMLGGYLDFAKGLEGESTRAVNIKRFLTDIISKCAEPLPELFAPETIQANIRPQALERAVMNLLSNAQKYAEMSRVTLTETESNIFIAVEDNGPGIPPEKRQVAFKAFQRLDEARNQNIEGVGLGLSIARDIAQIHGGSLQLEESELGGLKAVLYLPI